ncbi:UDP-glucuronosyltransferase [Aquiflexum sp.]|uniref:UDP-glucuronosyltransferase n=1 Tax=Aquiflexum sp. TaxID=1872584 RepID=UPI003594383B
MLNYDFKPHSYFDGPLPNALLVKLIYPESQWGEEISIYANVMDGKIYYEAVDFYGNDIKLNPKKSKETLSLQEIILMIETMEPELESAQGNVALTLSGIPQAESLVYPELKKYFSDKRMAFGLS